MFGVPRSRGQGKLCIAAGRLAYSAEAAAKAGKAELRTDTNGFAAVKEVEALMRRIFCTEDNEGSEDCNCSGTVKGGASSASSFPTQHRGIFVRRRRASPSKKPLP
jgi:hypothetical protein